MRLSLPLFPRMLLFLCVLVMMGCLAGWVPSVHAEEREGRDRGADKGRGMTGVAARRRTSSYVVLGYNDLGMHCMNQDFSQLCILPPFNTLARSGDRAWA